MTETAYRTARLFKILGNPLRYRILMALYRSPSTPAELSRIVCRPVYAVSRALGVLRLTDLVSYRTVGPAPRYFPKQEQLLTYILAGENFVQRIGSTQAEENQDRCPA